jgi:hypothetical protein
MSVDTPSDDAETTPDSTPRTGSTTFINTSGGLLTDELVNKLRQRQCAESAVRPETFALPNREPPSEAELEEEIGDAWNTLRERWDELTMDMELFGMDISDARNKWILKFFRALEFEPLYQRENLEAGGIEANLSHKGWPNRDIKSYGEMEGRKAPILHTVEPGQKLDEKPEDAPRGARSPHDKLQEFLNASDEQDWAIVTNGLTLRVLRDYYHTYTRGYVEFDLENLFTNRNYGDFRALYRLCHASRFIEPIVADEGDEEVETPLEQLYQVALSTGVKVGQDLQENVVSALETLGNGFLDSDIEAVLEESGQDAAEDYYQDLLYVVYRILFLMFAEQRGMMSQRDSLYTEEYSITKLRERAEQRERGDHNTDLWEGLKATFRLVGEGDENLSVPGYNGDLFDNDNLKYILDAECSNEKLLSAVDDLTHIEQEGYRQRISYADLGVEEIGAVYESLLEFTPQLAETAIELENRTISPDTFYLDDRGMERKETGSYYTDPGLVDELIQNALEPVVDERVDDNADASTQEQQLLDINVCDPACGSGAFLIAANNFLGQQLAEIRSDSLYPDEQTIRQARRSVVQHCIYGVDLNPMAAELAKVSLWINSAVENKPLSFLDHRIKQGNSLIGTTSGLIEQGLPVDAYETSQGRDWHKGNEIRKRIRKENDQITDSDKQVRLDSQWSETKEEYVSLAEKLNQIDEQAIEDVHKKETAYRELRESEGFQQEKLAYDVWTAAFFWPLDGSAEEYPSPNTIDLIRREFTEEDKNTVSSSIRTLIGRAKDIASEESFFHWPLEFPAVFQDGGFDCILGNPPWEGLKVRDKEFFATRRPEIANASTAAKREEMIEELADTDPALYQDYQRAVERAAQQVKFIHESGRYPLTGHGNLNTYAIFAEVAFNRINSIGTSGIIVPQGIATDSQTQAYFQEIVEYQQLKSLLGFENKNKFFEDVDSRYRFCLLTLVGKDWQQESYEFAFGLTEVNQLQEDNRKFTLSKDEIELINPNTKNCPTFRDRRDAELVVDIYKSSGAFINLDKEGGNPWEAEKASQFDMTHDSGLFKTRNELEEEGFDLQQNKFVSGDQTYLPLYEAKFMFQYNHRYSTFEDVPSDEVDKGNARELTNTELDDPSNLVLPRYWIPVEEYESRNRAEWQLSFRSITNATNERTVVATILPYAGIANSLSPYHGPDGDSASLLLAVLNSYVLDYVARQKVGGTNLNHYIIRQLPVPSPQRFEQIRLDGEPISGRIKELVTKLIYTANDLESFARDADVTSDPYRYSGESKDREKIRFDLEALVAHIYAIEVEDFERIFDSFGQIKEASKQKHGYYRPREEIKKRYEELAPRITDTSGEKS